MFPSPQKAFGVPEVDSRAQTQYSWRKQGLNNEEKNLPFSFWVIQVSMKTNIQIQCSRFFNEFTT